MSPGFTKRCSPPISRRVDTLAAAFAPEVKDLANAEASDRLSRHLASIVARAIDAAPDESKKAKVGVQLVRELVAFIGSLQPDAITRDADVPLVPARVLSAVFRRNPDGSPKRFDAPLTPLLDTTLLTNSRGEPAVGHELEAEIHSADSIDVVMAFVRWSGIRPLLDALRRTVGTASRCAIRHDDVHEQHRAARAR